MKGTPLYKAARTLLPWLFRTLMPIRVLNANYMPRDGKVILCCNHISLTDPIRVAFSQRRPIFYMAKAELFKNWFVGGIIRALGAFPVARGKGDKGAIHMAQKILDSGAALGIFLEGTRSRDGEFLRPKSGAVMLANSCEASILPCCITPVKGKLSHLFRPCVIAYGPLISPQELAIQSGTPSEYRAASRLVMDKIAALRELSREKA
jgi:1-acyl-sn-glycerol-3-phosphate acyltransferase